MSLQVEKLEKNMAKLTIETSAEELDKAIETAYQRSKNKISVPGFRKGKVPRKMIEQMKSGGVKLPASTYSFYRAGMAVTPLDPEHPAEAPIYDVDEGEDYGSRIRGVPLGENDQFLPYSKVYRLGEDGKYFYIFRDQYGGFVVPREALGSRDREFRDFIEQHCDQTFRSGSSPLLRVMAASRLWNMRKKRL